MLHRFAGPALACSANRACDFCALRALASAGNIDAANAVHTSRAIPVTQRAAIAPTQACKAMTDRHGANAFDPVLLVLALPALPALPALFLLMQRFMNC